MRGNVSLFKNNLRLTWMGIDNNVNQQNFATGFAGSYKVRVAAAAVVAAVVVAVEILVVADSVVTITTLPLGSRTGSVKPIPFA